jgi:hypothetical protein
VGSEQLGQGIFIPLNSPLNKLGRFHHCDRARSPERLRRDIYEMARESHRFRVA